MAASKSRQTPTARKTTAFKRQRSTTTKPPLSPHHHQCRAEQMVSTSSAVWSPAASHTENKALADCEDSFWMIDESWTDDDDSCWACNKDCVYLPSFDDKENNNSKLRPRGNSDASEDNDLFGLAFLDDDKSSR